MCDRVNADPVFGLSVGRGGGSGRNAPMIARPVSAALRGQSVLVAEDQVPIAGGMRRAVEYLEGRDVEPVPSDDKTLLSLNLRAHLDVGLRGAAFQQSERP
jgi:hypothetical protein